MESNRRKLWDYKIKSRRKFEIVENLTVYADIVFP